MREFCGHGIGRQFHEEPQVLHYGRPGTGLKLQPGMIFTIEPMINAGRAGDPRLADGWTIVTADHSLSAQWEHTVLVTADGLRGADRLRRRAAAAGDLTSPTATPSERCLSTPPLPVRRPAPLTVAAQRWRAELEAGRAALRDAFLARPTRRRLLRGHARLVDRVVAASGARSARRRMPRWSPSAATAAASSSRTPTSTC